MKTAIHRFLKDEEGANMVEYALLVALVGVLLIAVIYALTQGVGTALNGATSALGGSPGTVAARPGTGN